MPIAEHQHQRAGETADLRPCDCGAATDGPWADVHAADCAALRTDARCCGCTPDPATLAPRTVAEAIALAKRARRVWLTCSPVADRFIFVAADKDDVLRELARLPADAKPLARFHLAASGSLWLG